MTKNNSHPFRYLKYDLLIDDFINHHKYAYKYPGQNGDEFMVIMSILHEMTSRKENPSSFIRWYTAILNLIESHRRFLQERPLLNISQDPPQPEPPRYLKKLERMATLTCRLGIILSTGKEIDPRYTEKKLNQILPIAEEISRMVPPDFRPRKDHMPFIWTHVLSIQHLLQLSKKGSGRSKEKLEDYVKNNRRYTRLIRWTLGLESADKTVYYQIDNFWNGFIT